DLLREGFGQGSTEHGEVLREHVDEAALDAAIAGDDAIAVDLLIAEAEVVRPVHDEAPELDERPVVQQQIQPLARREFPLGVLRLDARRATALFGLGDSSLEQLDLFSHRHRRGTYWRSETDPSVVRVPVYFSHRANPTTRRSCAFHCRSDSGTWRADC